MITPIKRIEYTDTTECKRYFGQMNISIKKKYKSILDDTAIKYSSKRPDFLTIDFSNILDIFYIINRLHIKIPINGEAE